MEIKPVHMEPTQSGWYAALGPRSEARSLQSDVACDFLVVGGGWMGLHCARRLGELAPDARIILVDAGRIGDGAAGRCAGFAIDLAHNPRNKHFAEDTRGNEEEFHVNSEGIAYMQSAVETSASSVIGMRPGNTTPRRRHVDNSACKRCRRR